MSDILQHKNKGDQISHDEWNALVDAVQDGFEIDAGAGVFTTRSGKRHQIALLRAFQKFYVIAKITAAPPPDVAVLPSQCKYSARALMRGWVLTDATPVYGRDVQGDECGVYPAKVGDFCKIWHNRRADGQPPVTELEVLTERVARGPCT